MRNTELDEAKAETKIAGRNINMRICRWHHPYGRKWRRTKEPPDESERGEWKVGLKLNVQKSKIMASGPITSWQIDGETMTDFIFLGSKITADGDCSHEIKRCLLLGRKAMTNLDSILKSRGITLLTKACLWFWQSQSYHFSSTHLWMWKLDCKESWALKNWCSLQWHPTPVLLPGKSHGRRSLVGCSPWGR